MSHDMIFPTMWYVQQDLAYHKIFRAKVGKGGINDFFIGWFSDQHAHTQPDQSLC